jgi:hypothetical protein
LIGEYAHHDALNPGEADHDVARPTGVDFEELAAIHQPVMIGLHIHRLRGGFGNQRVDAFIRRQIEIGIGPVRRVFGIVGRQIAQQRLGDLDRVAVVFGDESGHCR